MKKVINCKESMSHDEIEFVKFMSRSKEPLSVKQMRDMGATFGQDRLQTTFLCLDKKGFLLYEEDYFEGSRLSKYGLLGVREGSYAERWCKENGVNLSFIRTDMNRLHEAKNDYYSVMSEGVKIC